LTDDDFGGPAEATAIDPDNVIPFPSPAGVIPFNRMRAAPAVIEAWETATQRANDRNRTGYRFDSPLDAVKEMERKRKLPPLPMPPGWVDLATRCKTYPGEMIGISGPTGGGKTSFAIEMARAAIGQGTPVLWDPLELDGPQLNLRIAANVSGTHMGKIRDDWSQEQIERALMSVTDRWRYVPRVRGYELQVAATRAAVQIAREIYRRPPLFVVDYIGKIARGSGKDTRGELADAIEAFREMTIEEDCYGILLSQTSRGNNAVLTGKVDLESAADAIGVSAETGELEHACATMIGLNVFKADDAPVLDSHVLVTKARNTGREGRVGFTFTKAGGQWKELDHLPATPNEVTKELTRQSKDSKRIDKPTARSARIELNTASSNNASMERSRVIRKALERVGHLGMGGGEIRKLKGCGTPKSTDTTLEEMRMRGEVEAFGRGRWRLITQTTIRTESDDD